MYDNFRKNDVKLLANGKYILGVNLNASFFMYQSGSKIQLTGICGIFIIFSNVIGI